MIFRRGREDGVACEDMIRPPIDLMKGHAQGSWDGVAVFFVASLCLPLRNFRRGDIFGGAEPGVPREVSGAVPTPLVDGLLFAISDDGGERALPQVPEKNSTAGGGAALAQANRRPNPEPPRQRLKSDQCNPSRPTKTQRPNRNWCGALGSGL